MAYLAEMKSQSAQEAAQSTVVTSRARQFWFAQSAVRGPNTPNLLAHWQPATIEVMTEAPRTLRCTIGQTFSARRATHPATRTGRAPVRRGGRVSVGAHETFGSTLISLDHLV